ncbi:tryptophan ABC transporter substrate-binding protein [Secundilactobacillus paracollinoides]|uniref:Peptide ABC transporter substrate-binding protein n=1 Tax=Secundilactobacillus paracollinoides TaxID=240427 RepID=A0A1B2IZ63_9LACO|nr:tryptophan ABC transporter substrate-binding protein [Secundilactobacillus paracollinoides]ANZ61379.1 peptide ABC transporter substrate-binding protein [Secundilactobacillus paracollinoides]ANZ67299.1 peptide ABC transporter substrate-binding protein [Secundilactobacillus paracollinoides]
MKRLYALIAILLVFLGFAYVKENDPNQAADRKHTPTVGILQLMSQPALDTIHHGIIQGLKDGGFTPGKNVKIDYQNAENDQSNMMTMSNRFVNEGADAMIGIATPSAQALANSSSKIPIILGAVTDPKGAGLVTNNTKPGGNVTGVSDQAPLAEQLALIRRVMPHLKTLGIMYTSSDDSAVEQYKQFKVLCKQAGIPLKAYSISNTNDVQQVSQQMVRSVDAVYVPTDNTIASAMQTLVQNANTANVPVFPAVDSMVKDGGLATYSVDQYKLGVLTGKMTAKILKGQKPATTPIRFVRHGKLIINMKEAKQLGITFPASVIKEAKAKGEIVK